MLASGFVVLLLWVVRAPLSQYPHVAAPRGADEALAAAHLCAVALPPLQGRERLRFHPVGFSPKSCVHDLAAACVCALSLMCDCLCERSNYLRKAIKRKSTKPQESYTQSRQRRGICL